MLTQKRNLSIAYTAEDESIADEVTSSYGDLDVCTSAWFAAAFVMCNSGLAAMVRLQSVLTATSSSIQT